MKGKRAGFDIQNYIVTILLVMGILVTLGVTATHLGSKYQVIDGKTVSNEFENTYNKLSTIEDTTQSLENKLVNTTTGTSDADSQFLGDALNSLKIIIPTMSVTGEMIGDMTKTLQIPVLWQRIFTTVLVVMILTVIMYMIFKSRGTT